MPTDPACRPLLCDWSQATRGDLWLLASALRRRWPAPSHLPALAVGAALDAQDPARMIAPLGSLFSPMPQTLRPAADGATGVWV